MAWPSATTATHTAQRCPEAGRATRPLPRHGRPKSFGRTHWRACALAAPSLYLVKVLGVVLPLPYGFVGTERDFISHSFAALSFGKPMAERSSFLISAAGNAPPSRSVTYLTCFPELVSSPPGLGSRTPNSKPSLTLSAWGEDSAEVAVVWMMVANSVPDGIGYFSGVWDSFEDKLAERFGQGANVRGVRREDVGGRGRPTGLASAAVLPRLHGGSLPG